MNSAPIALALMSDGALERVVAQDRLIDNTTWRESIRCLYVCHDGVDVLPKALALQGTSIKRVSQQKLGEIVNL